MTTYFVNRTFSEFQATLRKSRIWGNLALEDIKQRYRRSVLGPFWIVLNTGIQMASMALVFSNLFNVELHEFLPYLTAGLIIWQFISTVLVESPNVFIEAHGLINTFNIPLSVYVFRLVTRNFIIMGHNLVIYIIIALCFSVDVGVEIFFLFLALPLFFVMSISVCFLLGTLGARFRDVPPIVSAMLTLIFFLTPIFWEKRLLKDHAWIADLNPVHHFVDVLRSPLIGHAASAESWLVVVGLTVATMVAGFLVYGRYRTRIPYWL